MTRSLLVLGAGGHGRVVTDTALECGCGRVAFLDDVIPIGTKLGTSEVIGQISRCEDFLERWPTAIAAVGHNKLRLELFYRLQRAGFVSPSIIHPSAVISRAAFVAEGAFAAAGVVVNVGATIHEAVILNTGATVDHDCTIEPGAHISPGAHLAGNVSVSRCAWVGIGAAVRNGVRIGVDAVVGAGSAVIKNVPDAATVGGVPARPIRPTRRS